VRFIKLMNYIFVIGFLIFLASNPSLAEEGKELLLDVTHAGSYVWRGMPVNEEPVIQPSIEVCGGGFSLNVWGNIDTTDWGEEEGGYSDETGNLTEIDYTASYEHSLGPVSLSGGFIGYTFPNIKADSTLEVFAGLAVDVMLSPSVTSYWDEDLAWGANYLSLDIGRSFGLWESGEMSLGLDVFAHAAYANEEYLEAYYGLDDPDWSDWSASVSLPLSLKYGFSITPGYFHSAIFSEDVRDVVEDVWDRDAESDVFTLSVGWSHEI
jgi:hypothetical protein